MRRWPVYLLTSTLILITTTACGNQNQTVTEKPQIKSVSTPTSTSNSKERVSATMNLPKEKNPADTYYVDSKNFNIYSNQKDDHRKLALLTFDDGPKGKVTTKILDILDKYHAKSIWFINGYNYGSNYKADPKKQAQFSRLVKEIKKRGHIVANHTWQHDNLRKLAPEKQRQEILSVNTLLEDITGEKPSFFRPPFGAYTDVQKQIMKEEHMQTMNWSVGSLDWELKQPDQVVKQVTTTMHNGGTILMHDLPVTAEALDPMLKQLSKMGYHFVLPTEAKTVE